MSTTTHKIIAEQTWRNGFCEWTAEREITFRYAPAGPLHFYRRNGDPADPPDPEQIEFVSVKPAPWSPGAPQQRDVDQWARDWLDANQDEAREAALADIEIAADDAADFRRDDRDAFIR